MANKNKSAIGFPSLISICAIIVVIVYISGFAYSVVLWQNLASEVEKSVDYMSSEIDSMIKDIDELHDGMEK